MSKKTICIDFNGVLDNYTGWKGEDYFYPPRIGVNDFLANLQHRDYKIVILTTIAEQKVWTWLEKYRLIHYIDEVTNIKPPAVVYLDDRAVCFKGDFVQALEDIDNFKAHWEA